MFIYKFFNFVKWLFSKGLRRVYRVLIQTLHQLTEPGRTVTYDVGETSHRLADDVQSLLIDRILQWGFTGHMHGVATTLPEHAVNRVWRAVFGHHHFTLVGRRSRFTVLPYCPDDVDAENDGQNEEHESDHRANDDRHQSSSSCVEE